jgi:hypothetical protein
MKIDSTQAIKQIDAAIQGWQRLQVYAYLEDAPRDELLEVAALVSEAIRRLAPQGSVYAEHLVSSQDQDFLVPGLIRSIHLVGVLRALREAYANGYLDTVAELVRAETLNEIIDQAEFLLSEGYKDAAAVMIGGVLEGHLRKLCGKHKIDTDKDGKPLKAARLNDGLKVAAYGNLDHKHVTAWLDLRNDAAHGHYANYDIARVELLLLGVRDFITRYPA